MKLHHLFLASGAVAIAAASPAHAILATQTVGPVTFSTSGTATSTSTTPISFIGFNTALGTLTGVRLSNSTGGGFTGSFSQNASLAKLSGAARTFTLTASPTFTFSNGSNFNGTASSVTLATNTVSGPGTQGVITTVSGSYGGSTSSLATNTDLLKSYLSGSPTISNYLTAYTFVSTPAGGLGSVDLDSEDGTSAVFSGSLWLTYEYDDGTLPAGTPSPLPLLGAGAAFGFSRKLRRRIQSTAS